MEENLENDQQPVLMVTEEMRSYLYDIARWANFLAIVGFVIAGFLVLASFTIAPAMQTNPELAKAMATSALSPLGITLICLAYAFAIFYPSLLLFKYSTKAKVGVLYGEQASLDEAFSKMKSLFKYWGVITLIGIALYILLVVLSALANR